MTPPSISIVVPAYNEEASLPESLRRIRTAAAAFHRRGWPVESIVCDNNSTDRTAAIASEAGAMVVFEPVNQISRARNAGAAAAAGKWLIFIDADSHPSEALFDDVADAIETGSWLAAGSTVVLDDNGWAVRTGVWCWNHLSRTMRW